MSVQISVPGVLQPPTSLRPTGTGVTDILSIASGGASRTVIGVIVANESGSARLSSVWWHDGTTDFLIFQRSVPANETVTEALALPIQLSAKQAAKKIKVQAAAADVVTFTLITTQLSQGS